MSTKNHQQATLVVPEGMNTMTAEMSKTFQGGKRREGALAWRMGPVLFASPLLGPAALLLAFL